MSPLERLRKICLALPEAVEQETWGHPTFRVKGKIFATYGDEGDPRATFKAPPGVQAMLVEAEPDRFFVPPYVGIRGWVSVRLAAVKDWDEIAALARRSYAMTAPKRLAGSLSPK